MCDPPDAAIFGSSTADTVSCWVAGDAVWRDLRSRRAAKVGCGRCKVVCGSADRATQGANAEKGVEVAVRGVAPCWRGVEWVVVCCLWWGPCEVKFGRARDGSGSFQ